MLRRQLALRERWQRAGVRLDHEHAFFKDDGEPIRHLHYCWTRWRRSLQRVNLRNRAPYKARHSSVSWNLMIGKNPLWVAKQHGHSVHMMLDVYATWIDGTDPSTMAAIEQSMQRSPIQPAEMRGAHSGIWHQDGNSAARRPQAQERTGKTMAEREGFESEPSRINKLLNPQAIQSPLILRNPRSCQ